MLKMLSKLQGTGTHTYICCLDSRGVLSVTGTTHGAMRASTPISRCFVVGTVYSQVLGWKPRQYPTYVDRKWMVPRDRVESLTALQLRKSSKVVRSDPPPPAPKTVKRLSASAPIILQWHLRHDNDSSRKHTSRKKGTITQSWLYAQYTSH